MVKILRFCFFCVLSGCSAFDFDPTEYGRVIEIKLLAEEATPYCGTEKVKPYIDSINNLLRFQAEYSKYRKLRVNVFNSSVELKSMTVEFSELSSKEYCIQKLANIASATSKMAESLGN